MTTEIFENDRLAFTAYAGPETNPPGGERRRVEVGIFGGKDFASVSLAEMDQICAAWAAYRKRGGQTVTVRRVVDWPCSPDCETCGNARP